jgi:hypothetical protein
MSRKVALDAKAAWLFFQRAAYKAGMTHAEFASEMGLTRNATYEWRARRSGMSVETKERIDAYLAKPRVRPEMAVLLQRWDSSFCTRSVLQASDPAV